MIYFFQEKNNICLSSKNQDIPRYIPFSTQGPLSLLCLKDIKRRKNNNNNNKTAVLPHIVLLHIISSFSF